MRRRLLSRLAVAAVLAAGCWATVHAGEEDAPKSSWVGKLWPWSSAKKIPEAQKDAKGQPISAAKTEVATARRLRAEIDWKRRAEVCQKLRQIAYESQDEELDRFAERLDQRAWDAYLKQTAGSAPDERIERIGIDFNRAQPGPKTLPAAKDKTREERE